MRLRTVSYIDDDDDLSGKVWLCAVCEAPFGEPHKEGCRCKLYEATDPLDIEVVE